MPLKVCINPECKLGIAKDAIYQDTNVNDGKCAECGNDLPKSEYSSEDSEEGL